MLKSRSVSLSSIDEDVSTQFKQAMVRVQRVGMVLMQHATVRRRTMCACMPVCAENATGVMLAEGGNGTGWQELRVHASFLRVLLQEDLILGRSQRLPVHGGNGDGDVRVCV